MPIVARGGLIDDGDEGRVRGIALVKRAALNESHAHRLNISGAYHSDVRDEALARSESGVALDGNRTCAAPVGEREPSGATGGEDTRRMVEAIQNLLKEGIAADGILIFGEGQVGLCGEDVGRTKTWIESANVEEAANHEGSARK